MARNEKIIRDYRNGSARERLDTYLAHPVLRDRFDEIEREEERRPSPGKATKGKGRTWRLCRTLTLGRRADPS